MLSQKNLSKKFFTRTGEEVFRLEEVIEQPVVVLVNLESRLKLRVRLGTPEAKEFVPILMPMVKPAPVPVIKRAEKKEPPVVPKKKKNLQVLVRQDVQRMLQQTM